MFVNGEGISNLETKEPLKKEVTTILKQILLVFFCFVKSINKANFML